MIEPLRQARDGNAADDSRAYDREREGSAVSGILFFGQGVLLGDGGGLAGKVKADSRSMVAAIKMAAEMADRRAAA